MAGELEQIGQDEIEKLLAQAKSSETATTPPAASVSANPAPKADDANVTLGQDEIEALLKQGAAPKSKPASATPPRATPTGDVRSSSGVAPADVDFLFDQAEQALASVASNQPLPPGVAPFKLVDFAGASASSENATLDLLRDVELDLKIELGRTHMYLEDVLKLSKGAVVALDRLAGDPVDIYVNGRLIARGEVLILNDNFCVRVAELVAGASAAA